MYKMLTGSGRKSLLRARDVKARAERRGRGSRSAQLRPHPGLRAAVESPQEPPSSSLSPPPPFLSLTFAHVDRS